MFGAHIVSVDRRSLWWKKLGSKLRQSYLAHKIGTSMNGHEMLIYRIITATDREKALALGHVGALKTDLASGFMHFSGHEAFLETAALYFEPSQDRLA